MSHSASLPHSSANQIRMVLELTQLDKLFTVYEKAPESNAHIPYIDLSKIYPGSSIAEAITVGVEPEQQKLKALTISILSGKRHDGTNVPAAQLTAHNGSTERVSEAALAALTLPMGSRRS